jgi:hypothetical protein
VRGVLCQQMREERRDERRTRGGAGAVPSA